MSDGAFGGERYAMFSENAEFHMNVAGILEEQRILDRCGGYFTFRYQKLRSRRWREKARRREIQNDR